MRKIWIAAALAVCSALGLSTCENPANTPWGNNYTVTFDLNYSGADSPPEPMKVKKGGKITLPDAYRPGYDTFSWWTARTTGNKAGDARATWTPPSNVTLYARWTEITYTIAYDGNGNTGGDAPASQTKTRGTPLKLRTNSGEDGEGSLVKEGSVFIRWNTTKNGSGTDYEGGGILNDDLSAVQGATVTLYAQWGEPETYSVTYDGNADGDNTVKGLPTKAQSLRFDVDTLPSAEEVTRTGYTLSGWRKDNTGTLYKPGALCPDLGTDGAKITLYAQWEGITYTIGYNANGSTGGAGPESQQKTYGTRLILPTQGSLVRTNYSFAGWNPQADGSGTTYPAGGTLNDDLSTTAGATVWLYAQWDSGSGDLTLTGTKGTDWTYNSASRVYTIRNGAAVTVSGTTTRDSITVNGAAAVTLNGVYIDRETVDGACPFNLESGANVTLHLTGTSTLIAGFNAAGIHAPAGTTLTITGANGGVLVAAGGVAGAGIGGRSGESGAGTITISSGRVEAMGGQHCAGIGGGSGGDGGTITISGGTVTARGGYHGAGIGGGEKGSEGTITISGGSGRATGGPADGESVPGVGPGWHGGSGKSFPTDNIYEW